MGERGPIGKGLGHRRRTDLTAIRGGKTKPPTPKGFLKATETAWDRYWASDVSAAIAESDWPAVERLFRLRDEQTRALNALRKTGERVALGSAGQAKMSAYYEIALKLEPHIAKLEAAVGATPMGRGRLGVQLGNAARSLDLLNDAIEYEFDPSIDDEATAIDLPGLPKENKP